MFLGWMCLQVCMHVWVEVEEMADEKKKEYIQVYYDAKGEDETKQNINTVGL